MLKDLTRRYPDVFTDMPRETEVIPHRVKLTDDTPIHCKPYLLPFAMREELRNEVDSMLDMGVVRPSTLPYASPILMVKKKDGSNRVCVDFRKLNKITEEKVQKTPRPTTKKQVRSCLGLVGYYRDQMPAIAEISAPLSNLLKNGKAEQVQ